MLRKPDPTRAAGIRRGLRRFYLARRRDLPWRRTSDPYAVWLSEVMLQQTTVAAVGPRWERFLRRFPTVEALALAPEEAVLAEWSGLGYYARASNLHRAAGAVAAAGGFPRTLEGLRELPGVGPYTAAAVGSIAFGLPAAVVDGNVARVLSRLYALRADTRSPRDLEELSALAHDLLPKRRPGDHNQAVMELGATVCLPRAPRCPACPLRRLCAAARLGRPEDFPLAKGRPATRKLHLAAGLAWRGGRLVLVEDRHLVRGHLVTPLASVPAGGDAAAALHRAWPRLAGRNARRLVPLGAVRHSVLDRRYEVRLFLVDEEPETGRVTGESQAPRLVLRRSLDRIPHGGLLDKILVRWDSTRPGGLSSSR